MSKVARYLALVPLFIIPFLALYVAGDAFFPFITGKGFWFRILVEIGFAGWIILAFADKAYRPQFSWTLVLYGALVVWMFIANLLAINPHKAFWSNFERMDGWVTLVHVFMFFVVAGSLLAKEATRHMWWRTFLISTALTCGVAFLQIMGVLTINQGGLRVDATFGNAIYFAVFLMFALGITLWQAVVSKGILRYLLLVLAAVEIGFLLLTASRGALIATFGGMLFAAGWALWRTGAKGRKVATGALIALLLVVGGFFLVRNTPMVQNEPVVARLATVFSIGNELSIRFAIWEMAGKGAAERPLFGWGQEGFSYVFTKYYDPSLYAAEPYYDRAHNTYLDWLIAGGIPAFLIFLALLFSTVRALWRSQLSEGERMVLLTLMVAYGIQALVVFDNLFSYVPLAIIFATAHIVSARPIRSLESAGTVPEQGLGVVVVPAVTAVTVAVIWLVNVPNMVAAREIIHAQEAAPSGVTENLERFKETFAMNAFAKQEMAEQFALYSIRVAQEESIPNDVKIQFLSGALGAIEGELARVPIDVRLHLQRAGIYRAAGDMQTALGAIDMALTLSPKKQTILLEKAGTQWLAGDKEAATQSYRAAYALDTSFKDPIVYLAISYMYEEDYASADAVLVGEFGTSIIDNDLLWNAYATTGQYEKIIEMQRLRIQTRTDVAAQRITLASAYAAAGRIEEARAELQAIAATYPAARAEAESYLMQLPKE